MLFDNKYIIGYWYEDNYTGFYATLRLKEGVPKDFILDMANWPKEIKNVKLSEDYGSTPK